MQIIQKNNGQVMLLTIMILGASMLAASAVAGYIALSRTREASDIANAAKAQLAAETGIDWELYRYYVNDDAPRPTFENGATFRTVTATTTQGIGLTIQALGQSLQSVKALQYPPAVTVVQGPSAPPAGEQPPTEQPPSGGTGGGGMSTTTPSEPPMVFQCSDGIDNDGDGLTDWQQDPGCINESDNDETNAPPQAPAAPVAGPVVFRSVEETSDGGYIVSGSSNNAQDLLIVKLDSAGNVSWAKNIPGQGIGYSIKETFTRRVGGSSTGYIVVGGSLIKLNLFGDVEWAAAGHGLSSGGTYGVAPAQARVEQTFDAAGDGDGFVVGGGRLIVKYGQSGNKEWARTINGDTSHQIHAIRQAYNSAGIPIGYIVGGSYFTSAERVDLMIINLDAAGSFVWGKRIGTVLEDEGYDVMQDTDGNFVLVGRSRLNSTDDSRLPNSVSVVAKFNSGGTELWKKFGSGYALALQQNISGAYVIAGISYGVSYGPTSASRTYSFGVQVRDKTTGDVISNQTKSFKTTSPVYNVAYEQAYGIDATGDGGFVAVGSAKAPGGLMVKLQSNFAVIWGKLFGQSSSPYNTLASGNLFAGTAMQSMTSNALASTVISDATDATNINQISISSVSVAVPSLLLNLASGL